MNWKEFLENKDRLFWVVHTAGWCGFALVHYLGSLLHDLRDLFVIIIILNAYAGWLLSIPLRYLYQRIWNFSPIKILIIGFLASYITGVVWQVVQNLNYWEIYKHGFRPDFWLYYTKNSIFSFSVMLSWSVLYFGTKYYQMLQKEKQKALQAANMANEAQLKMLRYQLNPHFLFNTLNAISTLVLCQENKTANGMVTKLSDFLRYSLHTDPIKKVPLKQEIKALGLYLDIEKIRFEDRLTVEWHITEDAKKALVPSLLLQPLIENSIKYAIAANTQGGVIRIVAKTFGHDLLLEVSDNGPGLDCSKANKDTGGVGVGIANTKDRLLTLYDDYSFALSANEPTGLKVNIRIPLEFENDH